MGGSTTFTMLSTTKKFRRGESAGLQGGAAGARGGQRAHRDRPARGRGDAAGVDARTADSRSTRRSRCSRIRRSSSRRRPRTSASTPTSCTRSARSQHAAGQLEGRVLSGDPRGARQLMPLLDVRDVTLQYRTADRVVTATERVSFSVDRGDRFVILGPSGCGKSTLLKAVAGFVAPVEGRILLSGTPVDPPRPRSHRRLPGVRSAAAVEDRDAEHHVCADRGKPAFPAQCS